MMLMSVLICISISKSANAQEIEIDAGRSLYVNGHDDWWYQEAFEHKLNYRGTSFEIGVHEALWQDDAFEICYGVTWNYLGHMHMQSYAVADSDYDIKNHRCNGACGHETDFFGSGHDQGFSFTVEPSYMISAYKFGAQAGAYLHHNTFSETLYDAAPNSASVGSGSTLYVTDNKNWTLGEVVGVSVTHTNFVFRYQYFKNPDHFAGKDVNTYAPAAWHGTHVISIGYSF